MDCDCSIDGCGDENQFHHAEWRTARKIHCCGECGRDILPGEKYEYVRALSDGSFWRAKTCLGCYRIRKRFMPGGWYYGMVAEHLYECIGYNYVTDAENPHYETQEGAMF